MHSILTRLGIAMAIVFPISLSAQLTLQDSLVAHYPFDGDALDATGNGNHGTVVGPTLTTDRFGNPNSAFLFDNVDDYISFLANSPSFKSSYPLSVTAWVSLNDNQANVIFGNNFTLGQYEGIWMNTGFGRLRMHSGGGGAAGAGTRRSKLGSRDISNGDWYHVAGVMHSINDIELYVNGKRDCGSFDGGATSLFYNNADGISGRGSSATNVYYNGKLDELRFYNRALTPAEILFLADSEAYGQDTTICPGDTVAIHAGDGASFQWSPSTGLSCTSCQQPMASPDSTTTYQVVTGNGFGCPDTLEVTLTVSCPPVVDCDTVNLNANYSSVGTLLDVDFTDTSTGDVDSVSWDLGDGTLISGVPGATFSHTYAMADTYTVCLTAFSLHGNGEFCADTLCLPIIAEDLNPCDTLTLTADFSANVNGLDVSLTDLSTGFGINDLSWDLGDGTVLTNLPGTQFTHTYGMAGLYTICLVAIDTLSDGTVCTDSVCQPIEVSDILPCDTINLSADFTYNVVGLNVDFTDQSTGDSISGIAWDFGNGVVTDSAGGQQMFTFPGAGIYTVCLEAVYMEGEIECRDTLCQDIEVRSPDNIRDLIRSWDIESTLTPGIYQLSTEQPLRPGTKLEIWTLHGQLLRSLPLQQQNNQVDLHPFAQGLYLLRLSTLPGAVKVRR